MNLGILDQGTLLSIDVMESPYEFRLVSRVGTRCSLHVAAFGRAITAFLPPSDFERAIGALSVSGPVARMDLAQVPSIARQAKAAAHAVSVAMGLSPRGRAPEHYRLSQGVASA